MTDYNHVNDIVPESVVSPQFSNESRHDTEDTSPLYKELEEQEVIKTSVNRLQENTDPPSLFEELQAVEFNSDTTPGSSNVISASIPTEETNGLVEKKKVTFPIDSKLVSGFLEPQDPWKNVPDWRTDDLLRAYKQGCEKHGTKPLNKVLQQLQCIENVGERYEILSLKGERLDLKQIESLEDIFRHVRFRCIDLEATHLDDEMAVAIFEMVEYYESACKLNISFNKNIGPRGWQSCSRLVRKTPCLTFIDARNCDLNERVIPFLGRALRMGCYLTRLQLQSANIAGRALVILVAALKLNETLKELSLGDNKFMPTDGVHIGNLLKYNHKIELLDLRNNHLQDVGTTHVVDGLAEQNLDEGLLTLVLWNNQISFQAMNAINKALTTCEYIETLNLGHNPVTNEGIHILKDGLLKSRSLLKLGLSGTKISCEGAVALAEVIADNNRLIRVDLQENDIKTAGLMALSLALKVNESLTRLDIDRETKKETGVKDYVEQQKRLQQDIASVLERNRDLARQREEEKKQIEMKNKENAKKLEEAASEVDLTIDEQAMHYIPSGDSIHRPKLLFIPHDSTVNSLDSPAWGDNTVYSPHLCSETARLPHSTEGPDLLSPQYWPDSKLTAKKMFSVAQVISPNQTYQARDFQSSFVSGVRDSKEASSNGGDFRLCSPLPLLEHSNQSQTDNILTPSTIQRVVEEQTMESYIQEIIGEGYVSDTAGKGNHDAAGSVVNTSVHAFLPDVKTVSSEVSVCVVKCDKAEDEKQLGNDVQSDSFETKGILLKTSDSGQCNDQGFIVDNENSAMPNSGEIQTDQCMSLGVTCEDAAKQNDAENINEEYDTDAVPTCDTKACEFPDEDNNTGIPDNCKSSLGCTENIYVTASFCDTDTTPDSGKNDAKYSDEYLTVTQTFHQLERSPCDTDLGVKHESACNLVLVGNLSGTKTDMVKKSELGSASTETTRNDQVDTATFQRVVDSAIQNETPNTADSGHDSKNVNDLESWNSVSESELSENDSLVLLSPPGGDDNGNNNKPDFFSSLTMNGLKQELASLIDDEVNNSSATQSASLVNGTSLSQDNESSMP